MRQQRWNLHIFGHVQGVGFRYQTLKTALKYAVQGWVANLESGSVQVVVEGTNKEIEGFVGELQAIMGSYIKYVDIEKSKATGEFSKFEIKQ